MQGQLPQKGQGRKARVHRCGKTEPSGASGRAAGQVQAKLQG